MDFLFKNDLTLLSAGLIVAVPVLVILLFVKKMYTKSSFIALTAALCATLGLCVTGGIIMPERQMSEIDHGTAGQNNIVYLNEDDYYSAFSGFLIAGNTDDAERIINECANAHGWTDNCSVMSAHLAFAEQNYVKAFSIYEKIKDSKAYNSQLAEAAKKLADYTAFDGAVYEQLTQNGVQTTLTENQVSEARALLNGGAVTLLESTLKQADDVDAYIKAADVVSEIDSSWNEATENGADVSGKIETLYASVSSVEDFKKLNRLGVWRVSRMKARLLNEDYEAITSEMDKYATCEEYTIATDLLLNDKMDSKILKKRLGIKSFKETPAIITQLKTIRDEADLSTEQKRAVKSQINRLNDYSKNELYYHLENQLLKYADDKENLKSSSKIYLSLAEYSNSLNKMSARNEYFSQALTAAANSDDAAYAEAMNALTDAIRGSGDYESVKDVDKWAGQVAENSSFVKGSENIVNTPENEEILKEALQDYTVKASAAITINNIDKSKFNEITATIQISDEFMTEKELENLLKIYDCSIEITEFTVKKVEYEKANIILCCDNSGSMSGAVDSLKNAVNKFLETTTAEESIGFYTFDSSMIQKLPLGSSSESIKNAVSNMGAYGGTNINGTVYDILNSVQPDLQSNNILILMTDGKDGYNGISAEDISSVAFTKGYVVYVMGMGSGVEISSLTTLADMTGGQFIYSPSDAQLESLYTFIHGQVKNKYLVTYKTVDTLTVSDRTLEIELEDQNVSDLRYYSLAESDESSAIIPFDANVSVYGLETRHIVKQKNITDINVIGTGFNNTDSMYVTLKGDRSYNLRATYIDEQTFRISVPAEIALGTYDVEVRLNNRYAVFENELTVSDGTVEDVRFGAYTFTASTVQKDKNTVTMSGNVTMNGWLTFNGTVVLNGSLDGNDIILTDNYGSRISFNDSDLATGVAKHFKEKKIPLSIPMLGDVKLFNASIAETEYPTSSTTIPVLKLVDFMFLDTPMMRLYPDKIALELKKGSADLPFQDLIVSDLSSQSPFEFDFDCTGTLTSKNIYVKCEAAINQTDSDIPFLVKFLDTTASMEKTLGKLEFDTADGSLGVEFNVKLPMFPIDTYVGMGLQWKNMSLDGVQIHFDRDFTKMAGPVPITFSDFSLGFIGLAQTTQNASRETVSALTLEGKMQISAGKVAAIVPKLSNYVGDVSVLQIPEATFRCGLSRFSVEAEATLELLSCVELLEAKICLGNHSFTSPLLGVSNENVVGIYVSIKKGLSWDAHNVKVELTGTGAFAVNNRFIGATYDGVAHMDLNWWIIDHTIDERAKALIGFYTDYSNNTQFTVRAEYKDNESGKRRGAIFYITDSGNMDYDLNYKY